MNTKKKIISTLRKADPEDIEKLISGAAAKEDVYARLRNRISENSEAHSEKYEVEQYRRISITRIASIAAAAVLLAGTVAGALHLMNGNMPPDHYIGNGEVSTTVTEEATTEEIVTEPTEEAVTVPHTTEAVVIPDEITPEFLQKQCQNARLHYNKVSADIYSYSYMHDMTLSDSEYNTSVIFDRENDVIYVERSSIGNETRPDYYKKYVYNAHQLIMGYHVQNEYYVRDYEEDKADILSDIGYLHYKDDISDQPYITDVSPWTITGEREENGRRIASVTFTYTSMLNAHEKHYHLNYDIDIETGLLMGSELYDDNYEGEENYLVAGFKVTNLKFNDEAEVPPTPQEIKKLLTEGGYVPVSDHDQQINSEDLSFLDE